MSEYAMHTLKHTLQLPGTEPSLIKISLTDRYKLERAYIQNCYIYTYIYIQKCLTIVATQSSSFNHPYCELLTTSSTAKDIWIRSEAICKFNVDKYIIVAIHLTSSRKISKCYWQFHWQKNLMLKCYRSRHSEVDLIITPHLTSLNRL